MILNDFEKLESKQSLVNSPTIDTIYGQGTGIMYKTHSVVQTSGM